MSPEFKHVSCCVESGFKISSMSSPCSSVCRQRRTEKSSEISHFNESVILDDIIVEILSRLPVKDVLGCQCVSKRWKDLTSTRYFIELHSRRRFPMILKTSLRNGWYLLDRCWEPPAQTGLNIRRVYSPNGNNLKIFCRRVISHNGLIVFNGGMLKRSTSVENDGFIIYNPIYHDRVHIITPTHMNKIYGVFIHPVQKELCTLWRFTLSMEPLKVQYKILNLEYNPTWRDIKNPSPQSDSLSGAVLIDNKYLYWMIEPYRNFMGRGPHVNNPPFNCDIMEYDIVNEEFRMIPCPVAVHLFGYYCYNVTPVDIGGAISLVQVLPSKELVGINMWSLKDGGEKVWTRSNYIVRSNGEFLGYGFPNPIAFWNGELVLDSNGRLYVVNLKLGTFRGFGKKYKYQVRFFSHVPSLVSLKNCKSKILYG